MLGVLGHVGGERREEVVPVGRVSARDPGRERLVAQIGARPRRGLSGGVTASSPRLLLAFPEAQLAAARQNGARRAALRRARPSPRRRVRSARSPSAAARLGAVGDELPVRERVGDEVARGRLVASSVAPSSEGSIATASNSTDGPPSSFSSASIQRPVARLDAADLGRDELEHRALRLQRRRAARRAASASTPSVTSTPTLRPAKLSGPFLMMLSAGDGFRSCDRLRAGVGRLRHLLQPRGPRPPSAPSVLVDVQQVRRPSARGSPASRTLLSSKTKRVGDVRCSIVGLADVELPGLAVVVGERLRPDPQLGALLPRLGKDCEALARATRAGRRPRRPTSSARSSPGPSGCASPCARPAGSVRTGTSAR